MTSRAPALAIVFFAIDGVINPKRSVGLFNVGNRMFNRYGNPIVRRIGQRGRDLNLG